MGDDVLEEYLPPTAAVDIGSPVRQVLAAHGGKQLTPSEGPVDQHGHTPVDGQRQDPLGGGPVSQRVIDLDEIQRVGAHEMLDLFVLAHPVRGDANMGDPALGFPLEQGIELDVGATKVMHLHQVDRGTQAGERPFHALDAFVTIFPVDLGRHEDLVAQAHVLQQVAQDGLRVSVVGGGVQQLASSRMERRQGFPERLHLHAADLAAKLDRAQPHGGNLHAARWNRDQDGFLAGRQQRIPARGGQQPGAGAETKQVSSTEFHLSSPCVLASNSSFRPRRTASTAQTPATGAATSAIAPIDNPTAASPA